MGRHVAVVGFLALLLIAGATVFIRMAGNPEADWKAFEKIRTGESSSQLKTIGALQGEYRLQSEAREDGFAQEFADAKADGAVRLVVYRNGDALFLFGIDRDDRVAWKHGRPK